MVMRRASAFWPLGTPPRLGLKGGALARAARGRSPGASEVSSEVPMPALSRWAGDGPAQALQVCAFGSHRLLRLCRSKHIHFPGVGRTEEGETGTSAGA